MQIPEDHTAVVTFKKTVQPKQYESESVEITIALNDGDCLETSLDMAREMVYRHLGRSTDFEAHATVSASVEPPKVEEPKKEKRKRRTKAEIEADKAAEEDAQLEAMKAGQPPKNEEPVTEAAENTKVEGDSIPTIQEVAKFATAAAAAVSGKEVNQLLKDRFGTNMIGKIEEGDRAEAIELLKAMGAE
jgi:hypothetical protein